MMVRKHSWALLVAALALSAAMVAPSVRSTRAADPVTGDDETPTVTPTPTPDPCPRPAGFSGLREVRGELPGVPGCFWKFDPIAKEWKTLPYPGQPDQGGPYPQADDLGY